MMKNVICSSIMTSYRSLSRLILTIKLKDTVNLQINTLLNKQSDLDPSLEHRWHEY